MTVILAMQHRHISIISIISILMLWSTRLLTDSRHGRCQMIFLYSSARTVPDLLLFLKHCAWFVRHGLWV